MEQHSNSGTQNEQKKDRFVTHKASTIPGHTKKSCVCKAQGWSSCFTQHCAIFIHPRRIWKEAGSEVWRPGLLVKALLYGGCLLQWGDQGRHNNFQVYLHMFSNISPEKKGISCSPNISVVREARSNRPEVQQERLRLDTWKMGRLKSTECPGRVWDLCPCWYLRAGWKCQEYFWNQPLEVPSSCVFLWFCDEWC